MSIDDEFNEMSGDEQMEDFAAMLEANLAGPERLSRGQSIDALVVKISGDWVFIDTGRKGEGVLSREEFIAPTGEIALKEGDVVRAFYLGMTDGEARFTTRLSSKGGGSPVIEEAWRSGIPVEGVIDKEIKGGFEVRLSGSVRAFCPFSQVDLYRGDAAGYIGRRYDFKVTQYGENGRNIVVSRRVLQEAERERMRAELRERLQEGMTVSGTIRSLQPFGAFVAVEGGIDGLIPISELAWGRIDNPADVVSIGQQVQVVVKKLDWESNKFSFSMREAGADPWQGVAERYPDGSFHVGHVARLAPFGVFVTLEPGIDGLIHISKLASGKRIQHPREVVREGEKIEVKIEGIDHVTRRISLVLAAVSRAVDEEVRQTTEARQFSQQSEKVSFGSLADKFRLAGNKHKR